MKHFNEKGFFFKFFGFSIKLFCKVIKNICYLLR